ncbi:cell wall biosynthesis glycosyltransferase-like protein [Desulfovibrio sp. X2]|uniref:glycosyltransferase family 2 protein n=1 Tax=Desulfovibrio sp. X2 TaxID=941449 RepID=UPI000358C92D|nr:glycosyltransferase [Desulfovibrio sp. X2]EPR37241.1 cell wall biosynthesis glycosyltransferase-like protein [Desulfovibrio sp. X2]
MSWLLALPLLFLSLAVAYLVLLALAGLMPRRAGPGERSAPALRFAVVIPAHNEEDSIGPTLESLAALDYPAALFEVVVVADNCTDDTAGAVRRVGVRCLERRDPLLRGKGYALRHAFDALLPEGFDAVVVVDADTVVERNFLRAMDVRLQAGQRAVQSRNAVANPDDTPLTFVLAVGNAIENDLLLRGREVLGLPSLLRGTGMCLAANVLRAHPWEAHSVTEDTEYALDLLRAGVVTHYAGETEVRARAAQTFEQASTQRVRWASGNSRLTRMSGFALMAEGLRRRDFGLADMGWCLFVRSKAMLLLLAVLLSALALLFGSQVAWALGAAGCLVLYLLSGVAALGLTGRRLRLALTALFSIAWLLGISALGLARSRQSEWVRTKRSVNR